jgi:hypothetical protein
MPCRARFLIVVPLFGGSLLGGLALAPAAHAEDHHAGVAHAGDRHAGVAHAEQRRDYRGDDRRQYRGGGYGDRGDAGAIIGGIIGLGLGAAIAGAAPPYYAPPPVYAPPPAYYAPPPPAVYYGQPY